jgi:biotin synthase-like enzyme
MAGYYIGTLDEDGCPYCRLSSYYKSRKIAQEDLDNKTYIVREADELGYCGCIIGGSYPKDSTKLF